jgi:hypothetical protein
MSRMRVTSKANENDPCVAMMSLLVARRHFEAPQLAAHELDRRVRLENTRANRNLGSANGLVGHVAWRIREGRSEPCQAIV